MNGVLSVKISFKVMQGKKKLCEWHRGLYGPDFSGSGPARHELISHLPARPAPLEKSPLICRPGPLEKSSLISQPVPGPALGSSPGPCRPQPQPFVRFYA